MKKIVSFLAVLLLPIYLFAAEPKANKIRVDDTGSYFTGETVESVLQEIGAKDFFGITSTDISNWDTAFGWGDHSAQNYLDKDTDTTDDLDEGSTNLYYTDERSQDAIGSILDNGTTGDIVFSYDDSTPKISATVKDNSHNHTGATISGIDVSDDTNLSATSPITLTDDTVGITVAKDITVSGTGMSGGANDVLPGVDADINIALETSKDIVAGAGLSGGEDNVLPGTDADVTLNFDPTELNALTWGDGTQASFSWGFNLSGTDDTIAFGSDLITLSNSFTIITGKNITLGTTQWNSGDAIDATKVANADLGDIGVSSGIWIVEDDSHAHTGSTISGLSVSDFTSANISQWTNDSGYLTAEVDGSITNEIQDLSKIEDTLSLSGDATSVDLSEYYNSLTDLQGAVTNDFHNLGGTDLIDDSVSGSELDGVFSSNGLLKRTGSTTYTVTTDNSSNWNTAFGWGNHASAGYLTSESDPLFTAWDKDYTDLINKPTIPSNEEGAANSFLTVYNSTTGAFSKARPTWANIDKTTSSIADITTKSHTALTDIGTNTHAQIDTALGTTIPATYLKLDQTSAQTVTASPILNWLTASELLATDANKKLVSLAVATYPSLTELSYVRGVTSAIQAQLNAKQNAMTKATGSDINTGTDDAKYVTSKAIADSTLPKGDGTVNPTNLLSNDGFEFWSAGTSVAPDGWTFAGGTNGAIAQEGTTKKLDSYSVKMTVGSSGTINAYSYQSIPNYLNYAGRKVTFGIWVKSATANSYIYIDDGTSSSTVAHLGSNNWEFLTVTKTIQASPSFLQVYIRNDTASEVFYADGAILVEGSSAFASSPKPIISGINPETNPVTFGGNVGIGTAAPEAKLHVIGEIWGVQNTAETRIIVGDSTASSHYCSLTWNKAGGYFGLGGSSYPYTLVGTNAGNVGIGTTTPAAKFEIEQLANALACLVDNDGTDMGLQIAQDGVLASSKYGLFVHSNAIQVNSPILKCHQDNISSTQDMASFDNDGTGHGMGIWQWGVLAATKSALIVYTDANQSTSANGLVRIFQDHASSSQPTLEIDNDGSGDDIITDSGAKLTAAGVWTDAPCTFAEKLNTSIVNTSGYIDKLKNLKIYTYQKKREVYGGKEDVLSATFEQVSDEYGEVEVEVNGKKKKQQKLKVNPAEYTEFKGDKKYRIKNKKRYEVISEEYPTQKKNPDAPYHLGYILDDVSTPEELIARNPDGSIAGISSAQGVNFLLAVVKEQQNKIDELEARIDKLEKN